MWNATNVTTQQREVVINLIAGYRGRVELIGLEAPRDVLYARNRARERQVPAEVIERLIGKWETPDLTEAHTLLRESTSITR